MKVPTPVSNLMLQPYEFPPTRQIGKLRRFVTIPLGFLIPNLITILSYLFLL